MKNKKRENCRKLNVLGSHLREGKMLLMSGDCNILGKLLLAYTTDAYAEFDRLNIFVNRMIDLRKSEYKENSNNALTGKGEG